MTTDETPATWRGLAFSIAFAVGIMLLCWVAPKVVGAVCWALGIN
jgi:hypothetical protein